MVTLADLPDDLDALKALVVAESLRAEKSAQESEEWRREAATWKGEAEKQKEQIQTLEHRLAVMAKYAWGPRTEKRPATLPADARTQWLPFVELLEPLQRLADREGVCGTSEIELPAQSSTPRRRVARRRVDFPEHLPRLRTTIELPEGDRQCCGQAMEPMGEEITRELERIETGIVHEIARKKYCCRKCQSNVLTAPAPPRAIEKGLLGNGWLAHLLVERFGNHLPYHRLEKKYESEGLALSRTVLCRAAIEAAERLEGVYGALQRETLAEGVAFADETRVRVQESKRGGSRAAWVWLYANGSGDHFYDYRESRGEDSPREVLGGYEGYLHDDGYAVYESALDPTRVRHVACWAHVRRKFVEAERTDPELAKEAVAWIARLYAIEGEPAESVEERRCRRRERAPEVLRGFREWLELRQTQVLPKSPLGMAIGYALKRWAALQTYLEDGRLELDNNRSERGLRAVAVGRKNWMHLGNERGGRTAAIHYSLVATCKARGIDPRIYLGDVLVRLREGADPATLTPARWSERHAAEAAERRAYLQAQLLGRLEG